MPSRELTEILALVPPDFADPEADYRAVRATMAPFHGHPVPAHVTVTEAELGGVRCAWYEDDRRPRTRARRLALPRRRPGVVPARRLPLLRGHAGRAARGARRDGGLPPRPGAPLSRRAPRLPRRLPGAAGRRGRPVARRGQRGLVRRPAGAGRAPRGAGRGAGAARLLRLDLGLVRRLGGRPCRRPRGRPRSVPHRRVGPQPRAGLRGGAGGPRRPPALAGLRRPGGPAPALPPGRAARHAPGGDRGARAGGHGRRGGRDGRVLAGHGARLAGARHCRRARGGGGLRPGPGRTSTTGSRPDRRSAEDGEVELA